MPMEHGLETQQTSMSMLTMSYDFRMLRQLHRAQILWSISVPYEHFICIRNGFSDSVRLLDHDCFIMPKTHCPHSAQDIHTFYHWLRDHSEPIRCVWYNRLTNQIGTEPVGAVAEIKSAPHFYSAHFQPGLFSDRSVHQILCLLMLLI
jgi:hypothetical protein